ncbi:hypothetical protein [Paenibacillus macerans]|uniref:hypothetical protein n=1 Tax=Paenibacillus macerans TaxID=44252 RepID=UPI003D320762
MHLLHLKRLFQDEGAYGVLKICGYLIVKRQALRRVLSMREQFVNHAAQPQAITIVAEYHPK